MIRTVLIFVCLQSIFCGTRGQSGGADTSSPHQRRLWLVSGAHAAFYTGAFIVLNKAWYADYERGSFHFFDDNPEWNQMDKMGHVWTTYQVSRAASEAWKWAGLGRNSSAMLGAASGMVYQLMIELNDGYSELWGFSWGDMGANLVGAALFTAQELSWAEQKLAIKLGFWPRAYPDDLRERRNQLFGRSLPERLLKDYNSQTYWLSANLQSMFPSGKLPSWLNVAVGYGAKGLLGGRENKWENDEMLFDYTHVSRERRYFLSLDADLTKIKTNSKLLSTVFFALNAVKIPAPALEMNNRGKFRVSIR